MGTSSSSKGPGSSSPLVPPWADADPALPQPPPDPQRFRSFRTSLGRFVASRDPEDLHRALGLYATTATGGAALGARRFGSMVQAGGALFDTLSDLRAGGTGEGASGTDLSGLTGVDVDYAIEQIADALATDDGDVDKTRRALTVALSEALEGVAAFDPGAIDDDTLVNMMISYVRECVYQQVVMDSDRAFQKSNDPSRIIAAEEQLHSLIEVVVDRHMRDLFKTSTELTRETVQEIQLNAIKEVWEEWEAYLS